MHLIIVPSDNIYISCYSAQVLVGLAVTNVPCTKDLLNFSWNKKFTEFGWEVVCAVWDVQVTDY
jgi:hypothetical protein